VDSGGRRHSDPTWPMRCLPVAAWWRNAPKSVGHCGPIEPEPPTSANPFRSLCDHIYSPLQFLLQFRDIHLVGHAISVADAFHIAVLNQFIETPHYGYAGQLQCVRDLACANGRAHDRSQEDVDADGSVGQAVTVGRKLRAVLVRYGPHQAR
jgi:hypothetical protein